MTSRSDAGDWEEARRLEDEADLLLSPPTPDPLRALDDEEEGDWGIDFGDPLPPRPRARGDLHLVDVHAELERLTAEQQRDDSSFQRPQPRTVSLDRDLGDDAGSPATLYDFLGADEEGELVMLARHARGRRAPEFAPFSDGDNAEPRQPWHGTPGGYTNRGCRCERCRHAHANTARTYRERRALRRAA